MLLQCNSYPFTNLKLSIS